MTVMPATPAHARRKWTAGQIGLAVALALLGAAITFPAFAVLYLTVTHLVSPWLHAWSWTVPVSGEIAFVYMWGVGVLLAWRGESGGALRPLLLLVFFTGSLLLQVYAAHGAVPDMLGHILVVTAFFGCMAVGKQAVMRLRTAKGRPDRLGLAEWLLHPYRSAALRSWMALWGETSKAAALKRRSALLYAIAIAQADARVGRVPFRWRRSLPVTLRYQFSAADFPPDVATAVAFGGDWQKAVAGWVAAELELLPEAPARGTPEGTRDDTAEGTSEGSQEGGNGGTRQGTSRGTREGSPDRSGWPESKAIERAVLVRRTKAAMKRYAERHPGKTLPATHLADALKVRMSRDTATALLAEAAPKDDAPARPSLHVAEG